MMLDGANVVLPTKPGGFMKRALFFTVFLIGMAGLLTAQNWGWPQVQESRRMVTVTGYLSVANGVYVLNNDAGYYYVPQVEPVVRYVDGPRERSWVSVEGYTTTDPRYLDVTSLRFNGRAYTVYSPPPQQQPATRVYYRQTTTTAYPGYTYPPVESPPRVYYRVIR
jgi:hypothetical protein